MSTSPSHQTTHRTFAASPVYRFFYRQSALSTGLGMMIGPPLIATGFYLFFICMTSVSGVPRYIVSGLCGLIAVVFFIVGLRHAIYGGQWGCFIDDHYMTWTYPRHSADKDRQIPIHDILAFVVETGRASESSTRSYNYYIETAEGRFEINIECFGRAKKLGRALAAANPEIKFELINEGQSQSWHPDDAPWWLM